MIITGHSPDSILKTHGWAEMRSAVIRFQVTSRMNDGDEHLLSVEEKFVTTTVRRRDQLRQKANLQLFDDFEWRRRLRHAQSHQLGERTPRGRIRCQPCEQIFRDLARRVGSRAGGPEIHGHFNAKAGAPEDGVQDVARPLPLCLGLAHIFENVFYLSCNTCGVSTKGLEQGKSQQWKSNIPSLSSSSLTFRRLKAGFRRDSG